MADNETTKGEIQPAAAFQALPLSHMISEPLKAAIQAQHASAIATEKCLHSFIDESGNPVTVDFKSRIRDSDGSDRTVSISAPMLSIVPVPHLNIDELTTNFRFEVSHVRKQKTKTEGGLQGSASAQGIVSKFVDFSLSGSVSTNSTNENTANQSGVLDITVKASEAPMPAGLKKVLDIMAQSVITE